MQIAEYDFETLELSDIEGPSKKMFNPAPGERVIQHVALPFGLSGQIESCGPKFIRWIVFNELFLLQTGRLHRGLQSVSIENAVHDMHVWINETDGAGRSNGEKYEIKPVTQDMFADQAVAV